MTHSIWKLYSPAECSWTETSQGQGPQNKIKFVSDDLLRETLESTFFHETDALKPQQGHWRDYAWSTIPKHDTRSYCLIWSPCSQQDESSTEKRWGNSLFPEPTFLFEEGFIKTGLLARFSPRGIWHHGQGKCRLAPLTITPITWARYTPYDQLSPTTTEIEHPTRTGCSSCEIRDY